MHQKISALLKDTNADSALLYTQEGSIDPNFYYFTRLSKKKELSAYLILKKGKPVIIANSLEYEEISKVAGFRVVKIDKKGQLQGALKKYLGKSIGLNYDYVSVASFKKIKNILKGRRFSDISKKLGEIRSVKTKEELRNIKEACKVTNELFDFLKSIAKRNTTEMEIANQIETKSRQLGAEGLAFPAIIASGKNSASPHHVPGKTKLQSGVLLADIGVVYNGYCSDMTRTFFIGEPTVMHKHMYAVVNNAKKEAIGMAKHGAKAKDIFHAGNGIIKKNFSSDMIHSIGHGLGILVHDYPHGIGQNSAFRLKENMCLAVEPAYYNHDCGVRIEDDIVVTKGKARLLSEAPDELIQL